MRCKYCGAKNKKGVKFCGSCGKPMKYKEKRKENLTISLPKRKAKKHRKWWIVIAGCFTACRRGRLYGLFIVKAGQNYPNIRIYFKKPICCLKMKRQTKLS